MEMMRKTLAEITKLKRPVKADVQGRLYRSVCASSYEEFCNLAKAEANNVEDIGLPVGVENEDIHYVDTTQRPDGARWVGLQA